MTYLITFLDGLTREVEARSSGAARAIAHEWRLQKITTTDLKSPSPSRRDARLVIDKCVEKNDGTR